LRLGLFIGASGAPWDIFGQVEEVVRAEKDGYDSFWFAQVSGLDALTVIALAGPATERIEIGTAVVPTYTRHPNVMAQQALTVNAATRGRLVLGIGPSHRPVIERLGLSYDQAALHVREYVSIVRALVHEGRVEFEGQKYSVRTALQVPGARPFPILISALAPLMLRTAGEVADGTVTWMAGRKAIETHVAPRVRAAAKEAGRPEPRIVVGIPVAVCDDPAAGRRRAAQIFQLYGNLPNYRRILDVEGANPEDVAVCGPEATVEAGLRAFAAAGATDLIVSLYPVGDDTQASLQRTREFVNTLTGKL
jgi:5,10-methylenetetrahydromethanopterin reductase